LAAHAPAAGPPPAAMSEIRADSARLRRRATRGIGVLSLQTVVIKGTMFGSNIVLARLLAPRAFGAVAFGTALVAVALILSDGGIGMSLIRGPKEPDELDLGSILGFQLAITVTLAAVTAAIGLTLGEVGRVTALVAVTLPLSSLSSPGAIMLERRLGYGSVAVIDAVATAAYATWAIVTVSLGAGVWGLASALVVQTLARGIATLVKVPESRVRPRLRIDRLRPMLRFGGLFQASGLVDLARDQILNSGTLAIDGLGTLGLWTLAGQMALVPFNVLAILARVAFPTIARLIEAGCDPAAELEAAMQTVAVPLGLASAGLVGTAPVLVPLVFGRNWLGVVPVLPWVGLALLLTGPVNVVLGGYLFARNKPGVMLGANLIEVVAAIGTSLPLLHVLGAQALGIGFLVGAIVDMPVYRAAIRPWSNARVAVSIAAQVAGMVMASAAGWFTAKALGVHVGALLASGSITAVVYLALMASASRPACIRCISYGRSALSRRNPAGAAY
jgi:lipopolysaccharide exporter